MNIEYIIANQVLSHKGFTVIFFVYGLWELFLFPTVLKILHLQPIMILLLVG